MTSIILSTTDVAIAEYLLSYKKTVALSSFTCMHIQ